MKHINTTCVNKHNVDVTVTGYNMFTPLSPVGKQYLTKQFALHALFSAVQ